MVFPSLAELREKLISSLRAQAGIPERAVRVLAVPYRICPLGAHLDHQGGPVLGKNINAFTVLAFAPQTKPDVRLFSLNFPGEVSFSLPVNTPPDFNDWGRYARGAASVLSDGRALRHGLTGAVSGSLPGGGLSSSASVGLAYLCALAEVNEVTLQPRELIELDRRIENEYLGLNNGILDPATITLSRRDALLSLDTRSRAFDYIPDPPIAKRHQFLIAFSGYTRELTATGFNDRVRECREAARELGRLAGLQPAEILSDIPASAYAEHRAGLPAHWMRRAEHYFSECERVEQGRQAWARGELARFGELMKQTFWSSVHNYECGSEPLKHLQEIFSSTAGVLGSRFLGGGYGGCVAGLVDTDRAEQAADAIGRAYRAAHPETKERAAVYLADFESGIRFI